MPPFDTYATLINKKLVLPSQRTRYVAVDRDHFAVLLAPHVARIHVDEAWYLKQAPDVREAVERGEFRSAADHYVKVGYFEHRMPYLIEVDEHWYREAYPDIGEAVEQGVFVSGQAHFRELGFREGRFPYPKFRLRVRDR
jgi:hypothetical protein